MSELDKLNYNRMDDLITIMRGELTQLKRGIQRDDGSIMHEDKIVQDKVFEGVLNIMLEHYLRKPT